MRAEVLRAVIFWASSIGYMVAHAIYEGADAIGVWGADMLLDEEYGYQRDNLSWLLGIAEGRGIEVVVPDQSALLKVNFVYGLQPPPVANGNPVSSGFLSTRREGYDGNVKLLKRQVDMISGRILEVQDIAGLLNTEGGVTADQLRERVELLNGQHSEKASELMRFVGAIAEVDALSDYVKHYERGGVIPGGQSCETGS